MPISVNQHCANYVNTLSCPVMTALRLFHHSQTDCP